LSRVDWIKLMIAAAFLPSGQEPANSQIEPKSPRAHGLLPLMPN
jgi:hypothetical protein